MIQTRIIMCLRSALLIALLCTLAHAQSTTQQTFDQAYWAHQPPAVAALQNMQGDVRTSTAMSLATQGNTIDVPIMVWAWDPYLVMLMRQQYGYTWVPSALMPPVTMAPGITVPGQASYDPANPPAGAIRVSLNLADYPPYTAPVAAAPVVAPTSCVGISLGAGYYQALSGTNCNLTDGQLYISDPRGTFVFHISATPFNPSGSRWFTQAAN